jgi:hypothetical protein
MKQYKRQRIFTLIKYVRRVILISFLVVGCSNFISPRQPTNQIVMAQTVNHSDISSMFQDILPTLKAQTKVPIMLPTYIPEIDRISPLYANIITATDTEYGIILGIDPECNGANWCNRGSIFASAEEPKDEGSEDSASEGKLVLLNNGINAYFFDAECGANCDEATITWKQNNYYYTVGNQAGDLETLVKIANSMIKY